MRPMYPRCACGCGKIQLRHEATAWEGDTWAIVPGGTVIAASPDRCRLDETDTTAERCESCGRWTLDRRPVSNGGETVIVCGDCADGTYPAQWKARKEEHA